MEPTGTLLSHVWFVSGCLWYIRKPRKEAWNKQNRPDILLKHFQADWNRLKQLDAQKKGIKSHQTHIKTDKNRGDHCFFYIKTMVFIVETQLFEAQSRGHLEFTNNLVTSPRGSGVTVTVRPARGVSCENGAGIWWDAIDLYGSIWNVYGIYKNIYAIYMESIWIIL